MARRYHRSVRLRLAIILTLIVASLAAAIADLAVGSGTLPVARVLATILHPMQADPTDFAIIWQIRAPMTAIALIAGVSLALAGILMQTVMN
ncbi:iron chelate uptake ABC transporter family permease subunit, partial [Thioclava sp. BHET1]